MRAAEADGINVDEHFNLMVEMVGVGSGARRSVENYHLTPGGLHLYSEAGLC